MVRWRLQQQLARAHPVAPLAAQSEHLQARAPGRELPVRQQALRAARVGAGDGEVARFNDPAAVAFLLVYLKNYIENSEVRFERVRILKEILELAARESFSSAGWNVKNVERKLKKMAALQNRAARRVGEAAAE